MLATNTSATMPTPNHASCRMATPPPARPTCSEASVEALRMTRPTVAPSKGQSTFCSRRRSMPTIRWPVGASAQGSGARRSGGRSAHGASPTLASALQRCSSAEIDAGDLFHEDGVEDLPRDRRRHLPALTTALDEDDDHRLRFSYRRERGEPGVILALLGLGLRDHLGGARLAGDVEPGDAGAGAGAALVDDGPQRLPQEGPHHG